MVVCGSKRRRSPANGVPGTVRPSPRLRAVLGLVRAMINGDDLARTRVLALMGCHETRLGRSIGHLPHGNVNGDKNKYSACANTAELR